MRQLLELLDLLYLRGVIGHALDAAPRVPAELSRDDFAAARLTRAGKDVGRDASPPFRVLAHQMATVASGRFDVYFPHIHSPVSS